MKTIIAGSRNIFDTPLLLDAIKASKINITEVVSGGAKGVDKLGEAWAKANNIPVKVFPAKWDDYGKAAGPMRNTQMAKYGEALIAIWDGTSTGTKDMILKARAHGLKIYIHSKQPELFD